MSSNLTPSAKIFKERSDYENPSALASSKVPQNTMKYLGIDYGTKRIGVAVSDADGTLAFPFATIQAGDKALGEIIEIIDKEEVEAIVLGESRNFAGEANKVQKEIEQFKKDLSALSMLPVHYEPEFFTSVLASRQHEDRTQPRRPASGVGVPTKASGEKLDASAAALLLQSFLDRLKSNGAN